MIEAKVIADSIGPHNIRITTLSLTYPRWILAEFNTHRVLSRNSASSRAIPVLKLIESIEKEPAMPVFWGKNQPGMQANEEQDRTAKANSEFCWLQARKAAMHWARILAKGGAHKQIVNRVIEPWMHARTVVTATEWDNFLNLRRHPAAQPEFRALAIAMASAMQQSEPKVLQAGEWHIPYTRPEDKNPLACSVARCARVSYLTHEGKEPEETKDVALHDRLLADGHMSPFEHQAWCAPDSQFYANFRGWKQYRKFIPNEHDRLNELLQQ